MTIGLTAFLLISLYVRDEMSYDSFHQESDEIYLLTSYDTAKDNRSSSIPTDFAELVKRGVPQVETFTRVKRRTWKSIDLIESNQSDFYTNKMFYADPNFFEFFDFGLIDGSRPVVLSKKGSVVLTESFAMKLFNRLDVIGEELTFNKEDKYYVAGICRDVPKNSSLQFDLIARGPENTFKDKFPNGYLQNATSFVKLPKQMALKSVLDPINNEVRTTASYFKVKPNVLYELEKLEDIRMKAGLTSTDFETSDAQTIMVFSIIAMVILLLAVINYVNLVTAQSVKRVKEVGLRKVVGASRGHLLKYQLLESTVIAMISLVLSFGITERLIPVFNAYLQKEIVLNYFSFDFFLWVIVVGVALGIIAGLYPAYYTTRVGPLSLMHKSHEVRGKGYFRKGLVLFQFTVSGIVILALLVMSQQMRFLEEQSMGFDKENLITIPLYDDDKSDFSKLKADIMQVAGVRSASLNSWRFGGMTSTGYTDRPPVKGEDHVTVWSDRVLADEDFIKTLSINMISTSGKFKDGKLSDDQIIISESVAKKFGWNQDALEKRTYNYRENKEVVAISADIHSYSLKEEVLPLVIENYDGKEAGNLLLRIDALENARVVSEIEEVYSSLTDRPLDYFYINEEVKKYYSAEKNQFQLLQLFSGLAILISLLGLIAMTIYMAAQRRKEVSIRKVLGASVQRLILMLNREYSLLVLLAFLIASPVAYYAMQDWLGEFKYRITITPMLFIGAFLGFLALSWLVTLFQSLKVSNENPADVLREE